MESGQNQLCLQLRQVNNEHRNHPHGGSGHWWSWWRELGVSNHLLQVWPEEGRVVRCPFNLVPMGLSWSGHGGSEDLYQHALSPMGVFQLPLLGHNHSLHGHHNHPIFTCPSAAAQTTPVFLQAGCLFPRGGGSQLDHFCPLLCNHQFLAPPPMPIEKQVHRLRKPLGLASAWLRATLSNGKGCLMLWRAVWLLGLFSLYLSILHLVVNLLHVCRCTAIHSCSSSGSLFIATLRQNN